MTDDVAAPALSTGLVVLVGAPGSGKTTVGQLLSDRLGWPHLDVDARIERATGSTIAELFVERGEPEFRRLEREHTLAALASEGVVSLGGGAVENADVREALAGLNVVWLDVSAGVAAERVGLNTARPLLLGNVRGTLLRLLKQRQPLYEQVSRTRIDTDDRTPTDVADTILAGLT